MEPIFSQKNNIRVLLLVAYMGTLALHHSIRSEPVVSTRVSNESKLQLLLAPLVLQNTALLSPYVAHAGGAYGGKVYTNSIESLQSSYDRGYRIIEVDINLSSDNELVLIHDWDNTPGNLYGLAPGQRTLAEMRNASTTTPYHFADIADLAAWARSHSDVKIILDTKVDTVAALSRIAFEYPDLGKVFVPYIYSFEQYSAVRTLGFQNISLLTHTDQYTPNELVTFASSHVLHSVAMQPATLAIQSKTLSQYVPIYCWTINERSSELSLKNAHAHGVITDSLVPTELFSIN
jgi:glycerophosphoryl diester phosphodiesterase